MSLSEIKSGDDDYEMGVVPPGRYAQGTRSPIVAVFLCPVCAGFAPFTDKSYGGYLSGRCNGCGIQTRELHRFRAWIDTACGCRCTQGHAQVYGDQWAIDNVSSEQERAGVGENAPAIAGNDTLSAAEYRYRNALRALRELTDRPWEEVDPVEHIEIIDNALFPEELR